MGEGARLTIVTAVAFASVSAGDICACGIGIAVVHLFRALVEIVTLCSVAIGVDVAVWTAFAAERAGCVGAFNERIAIVGTTNTLIDVRAGGWGARIVAAQPRCCVAAASVVGDALVDVGAMGAIPVVV